MRFEHDRRSLTINLALWVIAAVWLMALLALLPGVRLLHLLLVGSVLTIAVLVVGVSPLLTPHEVTEGRIILRQGWHHRLVVPVARVKRLERLDRIEAKEGVLMDAFNRTLVMTDGKANGLRLELKEAVRVPSALWKKVDAVIFDVDEPDRFIAEVDKAR
jgi:membrane protein YdbS with pleckstrin-like domain